MGPNDRLDALERRLDALYRVASVLILGVVSLGMAYLYNRKENEG